MRKNGNFMGGQPNANKACAYCHSARHQGFMTVKMVKQHGCTAKQCPCFEKFDDHPYWVRKAEIKALKKANKEADKLLLVV